MKFTVPEEYSSILSMSPKGLSDMLEAKLDEIIEARFGPQTSYGELREFEASRGDVDEQVVFWRGTSIEFYGSSLLKSRDQFSADSFIYPYVRSRKSGRLRDMDLTDPDVVSHPYGPIGMMSYNLRAVANFHVYLPNVNPSRRNNSEFMMDTTWLAETMDSFDAHETTRNRGTAYISKESLEAGVNLIVAWNAVKLQFEGYLESIGLFEALQWAAETRLDMWKASWWIAHNLFMKHTSHEKALAFAQAVSETITAEYPMLSFFYYTPVTAPNRVTPYPDEHKMVWDAAMPLPPSKNGYRDLPNNYDSLKTYINKYIVSRVDGSGDWTRYTVVDPTLKAALMKRLDEYDGSQVVEPQKPKVAKTGATRMSPAEKYLAGEE